MASARRKTTLISHLKCSVCIHTFRDPRELPCPSGTHMVCKCCLDNLVKDGRLTCPLCRSQHTVPAEGTNGFHPNIIIAKMIEGLCAGCKQEEPDITCKHCGLEVCNSCNALHQTFEGYNHNKAELSDTVSEAEIDMKAGVKPKRHAVYDVIDEALVDLIDKLRIKLYSQADAILNANDGLDRINREIDKLIAESKQYMKNSSVTLDDVYDERVTHEAISTQSSESVKLIADMKKMLSNRKLAKEPEFSCDLTSAVAVVTELYQIRPKPVYMKKTPTDEPRYAPVSGTRSDRSGLALESTADDLSKPLVFGSQGHGPGLALESTADDLSKPLVFGSQGHGPGQFQYPCDIAVCPVTSNIIITDPYNNRVQIFRSDLTHVHSITGTERHNGMVCPGHVAVTGRGEIIITDTHNHRVYIHDHNGMYQRQLPGPWNKPRGVTSDSRDNIYVVNGGEYNIQVLDPSGRRLHTIGCKGSGPGQFTVEPWFIAGSSGFVYVTDLRHNMHQYTETGSYVRTLDRDTVGAARGLAVRGRDLVVVDRAGCVRILRVHKVVCRMGEAGESPDQLNIPSGVAVTREGAIIVVNCSNHNVHVYNPFIK